MAFDVHLLSDEVEELVEALLNVVDGHNDGVIALILQPRDKAVWPLLHY